MKYNIKIRKSKKTEQLLNNVCLVPRDTQSKDTEEVFEDRMPNITRERNLHSYENLNKQQAEIFDYVVNENRYGITLVQAGPGTGKTFTMLTIAHHLMLHKDRANAVIYKNDLVAVYRFCAHGYSLAKFFMCIFNIDFSSYRALEMSLSASMSIEHFTNIIVQLISRVCLINKNGDFFQQFTDIGRIHGHTKTSVTSGIAGFGSI